MATKSLGHLALACRTVLSSSSSCDMTTANGSSSACDFAQFNAVVDSITPDDDPLAIKTTTTFRTNYASQGTRHAARIATAEANFTWSEDSSDTVISLGAETDDTILATGVDKGNPTVFLSYNDGGYNDTAAPDYLITVA